MAHEQKRRFGGNRCGAGGHASRRRQGTPPGSKVICCWLRPKGRG